MKRIFHNSLTLLLLLGLKSKAQEVPQNEQVLKTMLSATEFMVEEVSYNGGYVWYYMTDFSRQWEEMEVYRVTNRTICYNKGRR